MPQNLLKEAKLVCVDVTGQLHSAAPRSCTLVAGEGSIRDHPAAFVANSSPYLVGPSFALLNKKYAVDLGAVLGALK